MSLPPPIRLTSPLAACLVASAFAASAQQPIGTVAQQDATVTGSLSITGSRILLVGNTTVTAKDHTAEVQLQRGGTVRICATSGLHLTQGRSAPSAPAEPLLLALDRGAMELALPASSADAIMTPDLRFTPASPGLLDLRLRVTSNGDTCADNHGSPLTLTDAFGEATYQLRTGQHVLFEHGSLKEVVDNESSPCGCPPPAISVADSGVTSSASPAAPGHTLASTPAEAQHPFPAAVSEGLAPGSDKPAEVPQAPPGAPHAQVAATLAFNADGAHTPDSLTPAPPSQPASISTSAPAPQAPTAPPSQPTPATTAQAPPPPPAPAPRDLAHAIGHFFKRLFGRG